MKKVAIKKRKGFTLLETILVMIVVAILAVAIFLGGKNTTTSAKISVAQSDFHTMELAAKQLLLEHPEYIKLNSTSPNFISARVSELNRYLPDEMQLSGTSPVHSAKLDQWAQNYRIIFVADTTNSKFFRFYFISNGENTIGSDSTVDADDLVMCVQLQGGDVKSKTWGFTEDNTAGDSITSLVP